MQLLNTNHAAAKSRMAAIYGRSVNSFFIDPVVKDDLIDAGLVTYGDVVRVICYETAPLILRRVYGRYCQGLEAYLPNLWEDSALYEDEYDIVGWQDLSPRLVNILSRKGVTTIMDLVQLSEDELQYWQGLGKQSINQIKLALAARGCHLQCSTP